MRRNRIKNGIIKISYHKTKQQRDQFKTTLTELHTSEQRGESDLFIKFINGKVSSISVYYQNLGGVRSRLRQLCSAISQCDYDVIVLVESWCNDDYSNNELLGLNYHIIRQDRNLGTSTKRRGGGVKLANQINSVIVLSGGCGGTAFNVNIIDSR